jgi:hypothetical protein
MRQRPRFRYAIAIVTVALVVGATLYLSRHWSEEAIQRQKAEQMSLVDDLYPASLAALSYIKRNGVPPTQATECMRINSDATETWRQDKNVSKIIGSEFVVVEWPPHRSHVVMQSVFERIEFHFPDDPNLLSIEDGVLMSRSTGKPAALMSVRGTDQTEDLRFWYANEVLWEGWKKFMSGENTGVEWLDDYQPVP